MRPLGIGKRIKQARMNKHWTQEELAKKLGVTKGAVANYENETSHPKESIMYTLISVLEVEPNWLFQDCVNVGKEKAKGTADDPRLQALLANYRKLNAEAQEKLLEYADDLVSSGKYLLSKEEQVAYSISPLDAASSA